MLGPGAPLASGIDPPARVAAPKDPAHVHIDVPASTSGPSHSINGMIASGVWWLSLKYSGPFLSWLSRFFSNLYCNWLIGGGTGFWGNIKWLIVCMTPTEETSHYAYSNAQQFASFFSAGAAYWLSHSFQRFWYRASSIAHAGVSIVEHDIARRLHSIQDHLETEQKLLRASAESVTAGGDTAVLLQLQDTQRRLAETESRLEELQVSLIQQLREEEKEFRASHLNFQVDPRRKLNSNNL